MNVKDKIAQSDTDLFLLISSNKQFGFDYLYSHFSGTVYGVALNIVGCEQQAQEIVQLTFINIWKSIKPDQNQTVSLKIWIIQQLIITIKEFLTSHNIQYKIETSNFHNFGFTITRDH